MEYLVHDNREGRPFYVTFFLLYSLSTIDFNSKVFYDWGILLSFYTVFLTCILFYGIDYYLIKNNKFKDYRINTDLKDLEYNKINKSFIVSSYNSLFINLQFRVLLFYPLSNYLNLNKPINEYSYIHIMISIILSLVFTDILFYTFHRMMHYNKYLYKNIHRVHHDIVNPYSISFQYCHTIESIMNETSVTLPIILSGLPYEMMYIWFIGAHLNTCVSHSGYINPEHDNHHHYKICEFGVSGIPFINMDTIFKTRFKDINKKFILKNK